MQHTTNKRKRVLRKQVPLSGKEETSHTKTAVLVVQASENEDFGRYFSDFSFISLKDKVDFSNIGYNGNSNSIPYIYIILDNTSTMDTFCEPILLTNIRVVK